MATKEVKLMVARSVVNDGMMELILGRRVERSEAHGAVLRLW
jgi:hypothetical protein